MRDIEFRGKRTDNGEWVYGYYAHLHKTTYCFKEDYDAHPENELHRIIFEHEQDWGLPNYHLQVDVDPETVGQYTGLKDKNGTKIFEGDMIKPFNDEIDKMVVEFNLGQFLLCLYGERGYMAECGWEESGIYCCFEAEPLSSYGDDIEVIGNIHDNPEPLRGDANA